MATAKRTWVPILLGVVVLTAVLGIAAVWISVAYFREHSTIERGLPESQAAAAFEAALRAFPDPRPALEFGSDRRPRERPDVAGRHNPGTVTELHALAWDPEQRALASVVIPMWLVRMKAGPIAFGSAVSGLDDGGVRITAEDIDRYGPGVLFDWTRPVGRRVLVSAQ